MAPTQPKRPAGGAYGIFMAENREAFTKKLAGQPCSAVAQMGGAEWKKLSAEAKKPYEKKYLEAKATYDKELQSFKDAGGVLEKGITAKRSEKRKEKEGKKKKDPNAPKRPAGGAYGAWLNANREAIKKQLPSGHKITDVTKKASELWGKLSTEEKKPYEDKYQKLADEYKKAMEEWKKTAGADAEEDEDDEEEEEEEEEEKPAVKKARKVGGA